MKNAIMWHIVTRVVYKNEKEMYSFFLYVVFWMNFFSYYESHYSKLSVCMVFMLTERFHSRGQHPCKFIGTNENRSSPILNEDMIVAVVVAI